MSLTYRSAGVNIEAGKRLVETIKQAAKKTRRSEVLREIGDFSGFFHLKPLKFQDPVLVATTDGVGTKLKLAQGLKRHRDIGFDLVAMCVNDLIVHGAAPLFFLDYLAVGKLNPKTAHEIISGITDACIESGCALLGGETAEMPGCYPAKGYDVAGFAVGIVEKNALIDGTSVQPGDKILGLASSGLHSNGFSLVRRILTQHRTSLHTFYPEWGKTLGDILLTPTRIYVQSIQRLLQQNIPINGMAHITGGGMEENLPRSFPASCQAIINTKAWQIPPIFSFLQNIGGIDHREMRRVFNLGIGLTLIVPADSADLVMKMLTESYESVIEIGYIKKRLAGDHSVVWQ